MSDLKICRICLRTEAKMFHFNMYQLKLYYEEVMGIKVDKEDGLPQQFCYECATILHKFHKFKEKCYYGQKVLRDMMWRGPITYESIYKIDRNTVLIPPLKTMTSNDRVKTYITRDSSDIEKVDESETGIVDKIENSEPEYLSDTSLTDREEDLSTLLNSDQSMAQVDQHQILTDQQNNSIEEETKVEESLSPRAVYVDGEKGVLNVKCEEMKEKRKPGRPKKTPGGQLDPQYWKIYKLSEEEALNAFRARAQDNKYLKAAFKCTNCFKGFLTQQTFNRHMLLKHSESRGKFECRFCHCRTKVKAMLGRHMKLHYCRYQCLRCQLTLDVVSSAVFHDEVHRGVVRKCTHCGEEFRHTSTYYSHLRTHRSAHVCTLCGVSFVSHYGLRMHHKVKHVYESEQQQDDDEEDVLTHCARCDVMFDNRRAYLEHLFHSALHTDADPGKTEPQGKDRKILAKKVKAKITNQLNKRSVDVDVVLKSELASTRRKRQKYMRIKPTTCHQCGEHFASQAACMKHHVTCHPRTSFYTPQQRHICEICGASLAPGSVATHQNMHTRKKLHTCHFCGKQFHSQMGLKRHTVTHTGEKPYACSMCDKRFTQSNSMKLHYRTAHLKQPYPKRIRRKKEDSKQETRQSSESNSDSSQHSEQHNTQQQQQQQLHDTQQQHAVDRQTDDNMHYLTLT